VRRRPHDAFLDGSGSGSADPSIGGVGSPRLVRVVKKRVCGWSGLEFRVRVGVNDGLDGNDYGLGQVGSMIPAALSASICGSMRRSRLLI